MKYDYGPEVLCKITLDTGIVTTKRGSVVAITPVGTFKQADIFGYPQGTVLYTVEFDDGTDKPFPENDLDEDLTGSVLP